MGDVNRHFERGEGPVRRRCGSGCGSGVIAIDRQLRFAQAV